MSGSLVVDWSGMLLRFGLYASLTLVFGLPLFALQSLRRDELRSLFFARLRRIVSGAAVLGLLLSSAGLCLMAKTMSGAETWDQMDVGSIGMLLRHTDFGTMWQLRMAALVACLLLATLGQRGMGRHPRLRLAASTAAGALALATLAWAGHGAMDEDLRRLEHLAADIAHLLAAGAWTGALAGFAVAGLWHAGDADGAVLFSRCLAGFARTGTAIVAVLVLSGAINYLMVVGPTFDGLAASAYGWLLLAKIALFGAMMAFASLNRYRLVPALAKAVAGPNSIAAVRRVRRSVLLEAAVACVLLAVVAWLGMLAPPGAG